MDCHCCPVRSPVASKLTISTANEEVANATQASNDNDSPPASTYIIRLTVSNTGRGMAPEVLKRALEPFFTTKDVGE